MFLIDSFHLKKKCDGIQKIVEKDQDSEINLQQWCLLNGSGCFYKGRFVNYIYIYI